MQKIVILLIAVVLTIPTYAQNKKIKGNKEEWKKELQDFKYKYLAQEIDLSDEQMTNFFELYAKLESERKQALKDCKAITKVVKEDGEHSEAEYERAVEAVLNLPIITGQIEKKYYEQFKTFLSYKQLYLLKTAERKFNKKLMELQKKDKKQK